MNLLSTLITASSNTSTCLTKTHFGTLSDLSRRCLLCGLRTDRGLQVSKLRNKKKVLGCCFPQDMLTIALQQHTQSVSECKTPQSFTWLMQVEVSCAKSSRAHYGCSDCNLLECKLCGAKSRAHQDSSCCPPSVLFTRHSVHLQTHTYTHPIKKR